MAGEVFILEANAFCSFGPLSLMTKLAEKQGILPGDLYATMVNNVISRCRKSKTPEPFFLDSRCDQRDLFFHFQSSEELQMSAKYFILYHMNVLFENLQIIFCSIHYSVSQCPILVKQQNIQSVYFILFYLYWFKIFKSFI